MYFLLASAFFYSAVCQNLLDFTDLRPINLIPTIPPPSHIPTIPPLQPNITTIKPLQPDYDPSTCNDTELMADYFRNKTSAILCSLTTKVYNYNIAALIVILILSVPCVWLNAQIRQFYAQNDEKNQVTLSL